MEVIKKSERNIFAVHDNKGRFAGIIELNDIKQLLFSPGSFEKTKISSIMKRPAATLPHTMNMQAVMETFDITHSWYLPVLNHERMFMGFISKSKMFTKYRESLASQTDLYDES